MTKKLSPYKVSRMMALYFQGYSQSEISGKLKVDQSTVSLYVARFKLLAEQQGLKATGEELNIMNEVESLHSLAAELKKAKLTVEEAKIGLKMVGQLWMSGIKEEDYGDLIQACKKMESEGFITSAVKLNQLENSTGMTYEQVVAQFESSHQQLGETQKNLQIVTAKLETLEGELVSIEKQKKLASQDLKTHMDQIAVDMDRLKHVEDLAVALKQAKVSKEELGKYIQQQKLLGKAGVGLDTLAAILEESKLQIWHDQGKELRQMLSEYSGLTGVIKGLQTEVQSLAKQADGLEQKAKLKGQLEGDVAKLAAEKASLKAYVSQLASEKVVLSETKAQLVGLQEKKATLEKDIEEKEAKRDLLGSDLEILEAKTADLEEVEGRLEAASAHLANIEAEIDKQGKRWEVFESLVAFVGSSSSMDEAETFIKLVPKLVDDAKQGKYKPDMLRSVIIDGLTGGTLKALVCTSCGAKFTVDKPPQRYYSDYYCPVCGLSYSVRVDRDASELLRSALAAPQPKIVVSRLPRAAPGKSSGPKQGPSP